MLNAIECSEVPLAALWFYDFAQQEGSWNVTDANSRSPMLKAIGAANRRLRLYAGDGHKIDLDTARFTHFIAEKAGVDVLDVEALTLGSHGPTMVPVPSQCRVAGKPLADVLSADEIEELVERTRGGGAEIVGLLKTGSAYYAPSAAAAKMVRAVLEDSNEQMPVCAWMSGEYGISNVYLGVPAKVGGSGVTEIVELALTDSEAEALEGAATAVKEKVEELHSLDLG